MDQCKTCTNPKFYFHFNVLLERKSDNILLKVRNLDYPTVNFV